MTNSAALAAALPLLACPHCSQELAAVDRSTVGCPAGHRFDLAKQGYLALLGGRSRTDTGDDAAMVAARAEFLGRGHYLPIATAVRRAVRTAVRPAGTVLEIGAGTGYYLAHTDPQIGIALDASRYAARRAASAHPRVASVLADAWAPLPIRPGVIDTVLVIFAPRNVAELHRVLRPGGTAVVVSPEPEHLAEIRGPLGMLEIDTGKAAAVADRWQPGFELVDAATVTLRPELTHADLRALVGMGPTARHRTADQVAAAVQSLEDPLPVTVSVTISRLRRTPTGGSGSP
jgi:SAM-dependent methyltransferase